MLWEYVVAQIYSLSEINLAERALLTAHFYYSVVDELNCGKMEQLYLSRGLNPEVVRAQRLQEFKCNVISKEPRYVIDGIQYHTCLCNYKHPLLNQYFELLEMTGKGILPDRGPYLDQAAIVIEGVQLIGRLRSDAQLAERNRQEQKEKARGR